LSLYKIYSLYLLEHVNPKKFMALFGLVFRRLHYIYIQLKRIKDRHFLVRQTFGTSICHLMRSRWALIPTGLTTDPLIRKQCHAAIAAPAPFLPPPMRHRCFRNPPSSAPDPRLPTPSPGVCASVPVSRPRGIAPFQYALPMTRSDHQDAGVVPCIAPSAGGLVEFRRRTTLAVTHWRR
jgi:hypothetical protein